MLEVKRVKVSGLIADPSNERLHGEKNIEAIKSSLKKFGQVEPLILNKRTGLIIGGHGRVAAMKSLGITEADITEVDLDNTQAAALRISLNRTSELADWDMSTLGATLHGLREDGFDLNDIGFDVSDLDNILGSSEPETEDDDEPEPKYTITVTFENDDQQQDLFTELRDRGFKVKR